MSSALAHPASLTERPRSAHASPTGSPYQNVTPLLSLLFQSQLIILFTDDASAVPDSRAEPNSRLVPVCACCFATNQFPVSTFAKAFPVEELEQREREAPLPTQCKSPVTHTAGSL